MSKSKSYRSMFVKDVDVQKVLSEHEGEPVAVGLDIGKEWVWAVARFQDETFSRPWRARNPQELRQLVQLLQEMARRVNLTVAMESTGTYADALRQCMSEAGLCVHRVSSKASHDWSETFDGVPSQHDGKDAAIVAELCAMRKSVPWPFVRRSALDQEIGYWVDQLDAAHRVQQIWIGRLESRLARHWPEAGQVLKLSSPTLLKSIQKWAGPASMAADPDAAATLRHFGRSLLEEATLQRFLQDARESVGVCPTGWDERRLRDDATQALTAHRQKKAATARLRELAATHDLLPALGEVVGVPTACVLWACLGDPRNYSSGPAYRKALGLNLAERSSGKQKGELHIAKRGKALPRRFLYFAALRYVSKDPVRTWYREKKIRDGEGMRGIVAVMRKLPLALHAAAQGETFDSSRLFQSVVQDEAKMIRR